MTAQEDYDALDTVKDTGMTKVKTAIERVATGIKRYETIAIWAEEAGALVAGGEEYGFGGGGTGPIGIPIWGAWKLMAVTVNVGDVQSSTIGIDIMNGTTTLHSMTDFVDTGSEGGGVHIETLATPVDVPQGTLLGFKSITVPNPKPGNVRVCAWLRREIVEEEV